MDITGVILLTGIGLVVGFLVAALIFSLRRESTPKQAPKQQLLSDADNKVDLWREGGEQRLVVEMNGVSYDQESKLRAEQRRTLESLVRELQTWLGRPTSAAAIAVPHQPVKSEPAKEQPVDSQEGPSRNPLKIFGGVLQPQKESDVDELDLSIVAQIDQILQTRLEELHLEDKGIQLVEGPDQGMIIEIGLDKYTEIEAIPDEEIRQLIRASVADWESSLGD
jgi:hypothetical protein